VLAYFGRAYGCLPEEAAKLSAAQAEFLDQTVAALADQDGRVVAVRLALFVRILRDEAASHRHWVTPDLAVVCQGSQVR
jgi:hypothetical protein